MRYHLTESGYKQCKASKRACPLGGEHFETIKEAEIAYAAMLPNSGLVSLSTNDSGRASSEVSRQYGHWSIIEDHLHNASNTGNDAELLYYSSAQGRLELARRSMGSYTETYKAITEKIEAGKAADLSYDFDSTLAAQQVIEGEKLVLRETADVYKSLEGGVRHIKPLRHYLVEESGKWMKKLSPEEQESIGWLTSNGFGVAQYAIGIESKHFSTATLRDAVDENSILESYGNDWQAGDMAVIKAKKAYARKFLRTVQASMKKAPQFDKPVVITRGTTLQELADLLHVKDFHKASQMMDSIESGAMVNTRISRQSRMAKIPLSATANPIIAESFAKNVWGKEVNEDRNVILSIKARTAACPVNVSAWGSTEYEVLTNPNSEYKIVGGQRVGNDDFVLELEEVA